MIGQHRQTCSTTEFHLIAAVKQFRQQRDANERNSQNILINTDVEELYDDPMNLRTAAASLSIVMRWFHVSVKGFQHSAGMDLTFRWFRLRQQGAAPPASPSTTDSNINLAQRLLGCGCMDGYKTLACNMLQKQGIKVLLKFKETAEPRRV